jgi:hypothetical protein
MTEDSSDEPVPEDICPGPTANGPSREEARLDGRNWASTLAVRRRRGFPGWKTVVIVSSLFPRSTPRSATSLSSASLSSTSLSSTPLSSSTFATVAGLGDAGNVDHERVGKVGIRATLTFPGEL